MDTSLWVAIITTAIGTYLMRLIPLIWMQKHLKKHSDKDAIEVIPQWLSILGPLMIVAMLGVSMIPKTPDTNSWIATLVGCSVTWLTWKYTRSLGFPVAFGVIAFGVMSFALSSFIPALGT